MGNTLRDAVLVERISERSIMIMSILVEMEDWSCFPVELTDCLIQHFANEPVYRVVRHSIGNDFTVS